MTDLRKNRARSDSARGAGPAVGTATMVTILAVLCLAILSALTFMTARSESALARRYAQANADFYTADAQACAAVVELRAALREISPEDGDMRSAAAARLGWQIGSDGSLFRSFAVDKSRTLLVTLSADGGDVTGWVLSGADPTSPPPLGLLSQP